MLFWLAQEELSEGVRKVEDISRKKITRQSLVNHSGCQILVHHCCKVADLFVWDMSCKRFVSWQKCCLFREEA